MARATEKGATGYCSFFYYSRLLNYLLIFSSFLMISNNTSSVKNSAYMQYEAPFIIKA